MKNRIEPYSYSLNHFYWRKILARKEKSTNEPSVYYDNYGDEWFAEQYITQRFLLSVSTIMSLFYTVPPWNTILAVETLFPFSFHLERIKRESN